VHHLLARLDRADHLFAGRRLPGAGDEVLDHRQGHVGVEQGQTDLAQGLVHILLGQHAATGEPVEYAC
jgi:hypothetical protein